MFCQVAENCTLTMTPPRDRKARSAGQTASYGQKGSPCDLLPSCGRFEVLFFACAVVAPMRASGSQLKQPTSPTRASCSRSHMALCAAHVHKVIPARITGPCVMWVCNSLRSSSSSSSQSTTHTTKTTLDCRIHKFLMLSRCLRQADPNNADMSPL